MKCYPKHIVNLRSEIFLAVLGHLFRRKLIKGKAIAEFEDRFAGYAGCRSAVGIAQARLALIVILRSLGLQQGDEIIVSSFNFHIIPETIVKMGFIPVFIDIEEDTYNMDVRLIEARITDRTRAILVTHMFGLPADMDGIMQVAARHLLKVIEDCAHALGSEYNGKKVGSIGDVGIFSFGPGKNMPCFGGGMITVNDPALMQPIRQQVDQSPTPSLKNVIRNILKFTLIYAGFAPFLFTWVTFPLIFILDMFGIDLLEFEKKESISPRLLSDFSKQPLKIANVQAAVGLMQLEKLDLLNDKRREHSSMLSKGVEDSSFIKFPKDISGRSSTCLYYVVHVQDKEFFRKELLKKKIYLSKDSGMSDCSMLKDFEDFKAPCVRTTSVRDKVIEIPNYHLLNIKDIQYVAASINGVVASYEREHRHLQEIHNMC